MASPSPSMDEAATKEELRPVKKQLVSFWETKSYQGYLLISLALHCRNNSSCQEATCPVTTKLQSLRTLWLRSAGVLIWCWRTNDQRAKMLRDGDGIYGRMSFFTVCFHQQLTAFILIRFVTLFWPKQVKAGKLEEIHAKMVMKEGAPRAGSSSIKQPRPSGSIKSNGGLPTPAPSSSHRLNGGSKPHR